MLCLCCLIPRYVDRCPCLQLLRHAQVRCVNPLAQNSPYGNIQVHSRACLCACRSDLTPNFVRLLRDNEAEVRVAAASKVSALSKHLTSQQIVLNIVPCVRELSVDSSQYVRAALASVVMELAPMLGKPVSPTSRITAVLRAPPPFPRVRVHTCMLATRNTCLLGPAAALRVSAPAFCMGAGRGIP